ncbi:MAG: glycerol-3-phosphate 1-O-acyltransferase PlsB [Gammaproteobacteria bacterium]|nr:glycerol-3-phosphate 1-O-acyltransferase PlsB [Gammaproteobacteria bacterium]
MGPDLSHRRTLLARVLASRNVADAIREHAANENVPERKAARRARRNAREIASDLSYPVIRFFDVLLSWLWNRLYDGVEVNGIDRVQAIAEDHTIIYTPSHRSHIDYLLMSYVLFYQGLMLPHVAAGRNLNLPVVGPLLRRAGAFFMRRSFRGDPLYSAVFEAYLDRMYAEGFSVEYFIEGGRSRTGRLLPPRGGMLRMTLRSFLRDPSRPLAFAPVYFGYEKVIEARTYMGELQGQSKRSESLGGLMRSIRFLRQSFGRVQVNFGEPIILRDFLDARVPGWEAQREAALAGEAEWLAPTVTELGERLQQSINAAAAVNPVGLLATVLLSTRRQALDEPTLEDRIALLLRLVREAPISAEVTVTDLSAPEVIAWCEAHGILQREAHPLGDILALGEIDRVLLTWYRNNIVHLFALPSLLAALLASGEVRSRARLQTNCARVLPYLRSELFLRLDDAQLGDELDRLLDLLVDMDLVQGTADGFSDPPPETTGHARLHQLAALLMPTLERYYIAIALIETHPSGQLTTGSLVDACVLTAQRMARLHGLDAPEFFDATLFQRFVDELVEQGAVRRDADGFLHHGEDLHPVLIEASRVLDPDFCQGVIAARRLPELLPTREPD